MSPTLPMRLGADARFWAKVEIERRDACWLWTGAQISNGYGNVSRGGKNILAHRYAYEQLVGPIPDGLQLDHVYDRGCRHRNCVNPAHLEPVSHAINVGRGERTRLDSCPAGHPYDGANTYRYKGSRACRVCRRRHSNAYKARKQGASV